MPQAMIELLNTLTTAPLGPSAWSYVKIFNDLLQKTSNLNGQVAISNSLHQFDHVMIYNGMVYHGTSQGVC